MVKTQIYLTQNDYDELRREAFETKRTMSDIVRGLIKKDLRKTIPSSKLYIKETPKKPGMFLRDLARETEFDGPSDLSTNMDHYLYDAPKKR